MSDPTQEPIVSEADPSADEDRKPAVPTVSLADAFVDATSIQKFVHQFLSRSRNLGATREPNDIFGFMAFATRHLEKSKSQIFQDLWVLWEHGVDQPGYFVEIGAGDGVNLSNGYLLETEFGWKGVVAEPNSSFQYSISVNRSCLFVPKAVTNSTGGRVAFLEAGYGEMSRLRDIVPEDDHEASGTRFADGRRETEVETISLNDLLKDAGAPKRIDFLSVDTEGSELLILESFDFDRWDVRLIAVEHNYTAAQQGLHQLLTKKGYRRKWPLMSKYDSWYVKSDPPS